MGIAIQLPDINEQTGNFGREGQPLTAAKIEKLLPEGLPDIVIGEPWALSGDADPVKSALLDYKSTSPGFEAAQQVDMPNPMDSAKEHLQRVAEAMGQQV